MRVGKYVLVGAKPSDHAAQHPGGVLTLSRSLINHAKRQGYDIEVIDTFRPEFDGSPITHRLRSGLRRAFLLLRLLRAGNCSGVIIFSGAGFSFYERILLSAICRLFRVHDLFVIVDGWFFEAESASLLKRVWLGLLCKIPYRLAASGKRWGDLFVTLGVSSDRISPFHYWLPESFPISETPKAKLSGDRLQFVYVGWMIKEKGIHELLDALDELGKNFEFSFVFIGGGTLLEATRKRIHDSGWEGNVAALGWLSLQQFESEIASADVFVLPSYAEGFPMTLIEAMAKGLPAICSDVGGISDSLHDGVNGYLIPPRQVQPLVAAMERYLKNPQLVVEHSRAALDIVKANHDADTNCKLVFDVFSAR